VAVSMIYQLAVFVKVSIVMNIYFLATSVSSLRMLSLAEYHEAAALTVPVVGVTEEYVRSTCLFVSVGITSAITRDVVDVRVALLTALQTVPSPSMTMAFFVRIIKNTSNPAQCVDLICPHLRNVDSAERKSRVMDPSALRVSNYVRPAV